MNLCEFMTERIASREAVARDMRHQALVGRPFFDLDRLAGGTGIRELIDPERILAECDARRKIVALAEATAYEGHVDAWTAMKVTLSHLADVHSDHPDYDRLWKS